jgi:hypothetical protein
LLDADVGSRDLAEAHLARSIPPAPSERALQKDGRWPWSAERLERWVHARLDEQLEDKRRVVRKPPDAIADLSRKDVVWMLTQLAPAAFVDGAWLAGTASPTVASKAGASLLFAIYRDELGGGVVERHHGNVMRATLESVGVSLPPCQSRQFAEWEGFVPEAFSAPALWLAMARRSDHWYPELLGLNLAIEMAGIGGVYARAIAALEHHGIDAYFFALHDTIDNAASGHTSWSIRAVALYMDELVAREDERAVNAAWRRVWAGFDAYETSSRPLVRTLARTVGPRVAWSWLRRKARALPALVRT